MNISYKNSIALIGCGDWGKNIARTLAKMGALASITDPSQNARLIAHELQVPFLSLEELLDHQTIRGVVIATPTPMHFPLAQKVLQSGKSVLVEKPLAARSEEISSLKKMADQQALTLMTGHLLLYHKAFQKLVSLVQAGALGKILRIETSRKNLGKVHAHEGVLWDLGPHDFSMVLALTGKLPLELLAHSAPYVYKEKPDTHTILMQFEEEVVGEVSLSRVHPLKEQRVVVIGSKGSAVFDDTKDWTEKLVFYPHHIVESSSVLKKGAAEIIHLPSSEPLRDELSHFIECIETQRKPLSDATQAQQVLSLIEASELSEKKKNWVRL